MRRADHSPLSSPTRRAESSPLSPSPAWWATGRFALRVHGAGDGYDRPVELRRPYALIGRVTGADVVLDDPAVSPRHVYLHLDRRGLFAVDLDTPAGSRIGPREQPVGWLRPGEVIDVAGYRIELAALHVDEPEIDGEGTTDPLNDASDHMLAQVTLYPDGGAPPLVLRSELIFAGGSEACGLQIDDAGLAPVQCVLVRSPRGLFVVDFLDHRTRLNDCPLRAAALVCDGDVLALGGARFECRIVPVARDASLAASEPPATRHLTLATSNGGMAWQRRLLAERDHEPWTTGQLDAAEESFLAWMVGTFQATHEELLRRQAAFQRDVMRALRRLQSQHVLGHSRQLDRLETLHQEVAALRDEVRRRYGAGAPAHCAATPRALPSVTPTPLPQAQAEQIDGTAAWLSRRIDQINQQNRALRRAALRKC
jgi:hypothetical protein